MKKFSADFTLQVGGMKGGCCAEVAFVPHSMKARWVREANQVIMVNGCFLKCVGRVLNNLIDQEKIIHIDA